MIYGSARSVRAVPWKEHHEAMVEQWDLDHHPHISIIGTTGSGKTVLLVDGLLPALRKEQVLVVDSKGWDPEINKIGMREVTAERFPNKMTRRYVHGDGDMAHWYRYDARNRAETEKVFNRIVDEGQWTLALDETRAITDREPSLQLAAQVDAIWLRGRRRVSLIAMTQAPRFVPASFYEQASHLYIGHIEDERAQKRLGEIGGDTSTIRDIVARLRRYEYLYIGPLGDDGRRIMEVTKVDR